MVWISKAARVLAIAWMIACPALAGVQAQASGHAATSDYDSIVAEAVREYQAGHWPEAAALFDQAHRINPNARTLRGMGMTAYEARRYVDALRHLQASLGDTRRPLTDAQRRQVRGLIDKAKRFVSRLRLFVTPADAVVRLEGRVAKLDDEAELLLDPGEHELVISAPGHEEVVRHVTAQPGQEQELDVVLVEHSAEDAQEAAPQVAQPNPGSRNRELTTESDASAASGRLWTWVALGGAAVFGASAAAFYFAGQSEISGIEETCPPGACDLRQIDQEIEDANLSTYEVLTNVSLGLSAASLVTAGVLFFLEGNQEREQPTTTVGIGPDGFQLRGQF